MTTLPPISVTLSEPLPGTRRLATLDLNPRVTSVTVETVLPGGYGACQIGLAPPGASGPEVYPALPAPVDVADQCHVVVSIGGQRVHEGVLARVSVARTGIESLGYGVAALNWVPQRQGQADEATSGAIARAALGRVPWLTLGQVDDPGGRRAWSEFSDQPVAQVLDALRREGDGSAPMLLTVYEERLTRYVAATAPAVPDYRLGYDRALMADFTWDYSEVVDGAYAVYTDASGTRRASEVVWRDGVRTTSTSVYDGRDADGRYLRLVALQVSAESGSVMAWLRTWVSERSAPALTGSITVPAGYGLPTATGLRRPAYLARAGEWLEIVGHGAVVITRTHADLFAGSATLQLGRPSPRTFIGLLERLQHAETAYRTHRDVLTGNRLRTERSG